MGKAPILYCRVRRRLGFPPPRERERLRRGLAQAPQRAARFLLGKLLLGRRGPRPIAARIVEVEAYLGARDPAAHAFRGRTRRTEPLFGAPGTLYVYCIYGMHHCLNLACDEKGRAGCVLIRAAEPLDAALPPRALSGPGRLARALGLSTRDSGRHLFEAGAPVTLREGPAPRRIARGPRVGISRALELPLRFYDAASAAVTSRRAASARRSRS